MDLFRCKQGVAVAWSVLLLAFITRCTAPVDFPEEIEAQVPEEIDFNYHVKPILSDRCFACHGPDENKREAGLRLDIADAAVAALGEDKDHFAIVPGNAGKSALVQRIMSDEAEMMMPPPESNLKLSELEIALLTRWVEQGAEFKPHWAFIKPEKPTVPKVDNHDKAKNPIDNFVIAKLEEQGGHPSDPADKETLIRRVTFDLTGLPPTVEEVDAFLADPAEDAYERLVNRLLESPQYGERMASEWLDVARYADSHGYQDDAMRNMWPWRDWVINAFNENMPYDRFILWQIAGDMLPEATQEQKLATGFNRNHPQSQEGGIVPEEYRVEYVADRTNTLGTAFLALSTECARCHDHKYDPISQQEYYQLFAFFNSVNETGQIPYVGEPSPTVILTDEEAEKQVAFLQEKIRNSEQQLDAGQNDYQPEFERWVNQLKQNPHQHPMNPTGRVGYYPLENPVNDQFANLADPSKPADMVVIQQDKELVMVEGKFGQAIQLVGDSYVDLGEDIGYFERNEPFAISLWFKAVKDSLKGPVFSKTGGFANGFRGYELWIRKDGRLSATLNHTWPGNAIEVHSQEKIPAGEWVHLVMSYDGSSKAKGVSLFLNGKSLSTEIITDHLKRSMLSYGKDHSGSGHPGNLQIGKQGTNFAETLDGALVDEFSVFDGQLTAVEVAKLYGNQELINTYAEDRQAMLEYYLLHVNQAYQKKLDTLTFLRGQENDLLSAQPEVMVMGELKKPRTTFILDRGAYDAPTKKVIPSTPAAILEYPDDLPRNRLGLARWLIHEDNPLTARVAVNRYWQMIFGQGIVKTSNDFGNQGELPTHPELLDWLAVQFRESGWDVKALLKRMISSTTYRQSSASTEAWLKKDPDNTWLSRGPAHRMPVEMIRDNALVASGLLTKEIGGRSVKPYQPKGLWEELATANVTVYEPDSGKNLYRRGLYTFWKRSSPPPSMMSFDASGKFVCAVQRQTTNTPLQALILLNDPQYLEAARVLAEKMIREGGDHLDQQITYGFRAMTSRQPDARELNLLEALYQAEWEEFQTSPATADSLLVVGEQPRDLALPKAKVAALTMVASTLINYDAAVYKR